MQRTCVTCLPSRADSADGYGNLDCLATGNPIIYTPLMFIKGKG
jgi:hypothetical protein